MVWNSKNKLGDVIFINYFYKINFKVVCKYCMQETCICNNNFVLDFDDFKKKVYNL